MNTENNTQWVSVSTMAKLIGKSQQTVRNNIRKGMYETMTFTRGKMKGILIKTYNEDEKE